MSQELSKKLVCVSMRNGAEVWIEEEKLGNLESMLEKSRFIKIDGQLINSADVVGVFDANTMADVIRRKNGQWKDEKGGWHDKGDRICPRCKVVLPSGMKCGKCRY